MKWQYFDLERSFRLIESKIGRYSKIRGSDNLGCVLIPEIENAKQLVSVLLKAETPHYMATQPLLAYSQKVLGNAFEELEDDLMPSVISHRRGKAYNQHRALLRLFLLNLVAVGFSHERLSIESTPKKDGYVSSKYGLDQRKTKRLVDALIGHELMELRWEGNRHVGVVNNYMPTEKLLLPYASFLYADHADFDDYDLIRLNGERHEGDIEWHPHLERDREILTRYNAFMSAHSWARKDTTHRSFNDNRYSAGRVHTAYQNIVNRRVPIRKQTLMDGEPIVEPDFTANHLTLLSMIFDEQLPSDPYDRVADDTGMSRDAIKQVFIRLMGASDRKGWAEAQWSLLKSEYEITHRQSDHIRESFYKCIPFLKKHDLLSTGWGGRLQYLEGEIAILMFEWAVESQIPIINVHDAFACKRRDMGVVESKMYAMRDKVLSEAGHKVLKA